MNLVIKLIPVFTLLFTLGCTTTNPHFYKGPRLPNHKLASISILGETPGAKVAKIDSVSFNGVEPIIKVLPGKHNIGVVFGVVSGVGELRSDETTYITVDMKAGHTYMAHHEIYHVNSEKKVRFNIVEYNESFSKKCFPVNLIQKNGLFTYQTFLSCINNS